MDKAYSLGLYEKSMPKELSWREKLTAAKEAGFDFVEISIDETDEKLARLDMSQTERAELNSLTAELGMPVRTMCLSGHRKYPLGSSDPETEARSLEIMEKAGGSRNQDHSAGRLRRVLRRIGSGNEAPLHEESEEICRDGGTRRRDSRI